MKGQLINSFRRRSAGAEPLARAVRQPKGSSHKRPPRLRDGTGPMREARGRNCLRPNRGLPTIHWSQVAAETPFRGRPRCRVSLSQELLDFCHGSPIFMPRSDYANKFHHDTNAAWETETIKDRADRRDHGPRADVSEPRPRALRPVGSGVARRWTAKPEFLAPRYTTLGRISYGSRIVRTRIIPLQYSTAACTLAATL
jgi:hypothetical protein